MGGERGEGGGEERGGEGGGEGEREGDCLSSPQSPAILIPTIEDEEVKNDVNLLTREFLTSFRQYAPAYMKYALMQTNNSCRLHERCNIQCKCLPF